MAFKMHCPKCEGFDYSIERDNRTFGAVAQAFELVYHCRCGKQMFGEQLVKEYERQKKAYEAEARESDAEIVAVPVGRDAAHDEMEAHIEQRLAQDSARATTARQRDEDRRWRERVQGAPQEVAVAPRPAELRMESASDADQQCAWPGCEKIRRPNSKYCSRACSNKNARARHKSRQKKQKKSTKSAAA